MSDIIEQYVERIYDKSIRGITIELNKVATDIRKQQDAEIEKLQAQVAMLRSALNPFCDGGTPDDDAPEYYVTNAKQAMQQTESDWLAQHDKQVRDEAYERAARKVVHCDDRHKAAEAIRNLKGTK